MPTRNRGPTIGQFDIEGHMYGLDKIVTPPEVIEDNGLRVIHLAINEEDAKIAGFTTEALRQARMLIPEVKSQSKPPWLLRDWQARRRKKKYGAK